MQREPRRHGHRRQGRQAASRCPPGPGHRSLPPAQRHHERRVRLPRGHPGIARTRRPRWSLADHAADGGNWTFTAIAYDAAAGPEPTTDDLPVYPSDGPPTLSETLGQPQSGASFTDGKIVVTGRAEDAPDAEASIARVEVGIVNPAGSG